MSLSKQFLKAAFGDAVGPNGRKVADNFSRWNGENKILDSEGAPVVVWHGTVVEGATWGTKPGQLPKGAFTVFDRERCGSVSESSDAKSGFWFSASRERADDAAQDAKAASEDDMVSAYTYRCVIRIENPQILGNIREYEPAEVAKIARKAKAAGHDGLVFEQGEYGPPDYLVFSANQVKVIEANSGAFSELDDDITDAAALVKKAPAPKPNLHAFLGKTKAEFLGKPKITKASNAKDLVPGLLRSHEGLPREPFLNGRFQAVYDTNGAAVLDGERVIASYHFGDHLVVLRSFRRQGIGAELVYQFRTRFPSTAPARSRTKASQALQVKVWERIEREVRLLRLAELASQSIEMSQGKAPGPR
jgi:GNAT superfamily N-acetyltransferase